MRATYLITGEHNMSSLKIAQQFKNYTKARGSYKVQLEGKGALNAHF